MSRSAGLNVTTRFVLDVNLLLSAFVQTGEIQDVAQMAEMRFSSSDSAVNALRIMRGVAQRIVSRDGSFQVHVTPHVWATTIHKLVNPSVDPMTGRPTHAPWSMEAASASVDVLRDGFDSMGGLGWTSDVEGAHDRHSLKTIVPASMRRKPFDIDDEDRKVVADTLAVAGLSEPDATVPVLTVLVTNDGGLQLANEWIGKNHSSFAGHMLPFSVAVMFPKQVAALMENSTRSLVAA